MKPLWKHLEYHSAAFSVEHLILGNCTVQLKMFEYGCIYTLKCNYITALRVKYTKVLSLSY